MLTTDTNLTFSKNQILKEKLQAEKEKKNYARVNFKKYNILHFFCYISLCKFVVLKTINYETRFISSPGLLQSR